MTDNTKQPEIDIAKEAEMLIENLHDFKRQDSEIVENFLRSLIQRVQVAEREATLKDVTTFGKSIASLAPFDKEKVVNDFIELLQVLRNPKEGTPNG